MPGTVGQTLSFKAIEDVWTQNGGDPGWAPLMASIAEAESGGVTNVLNDNPATGDYSVGLWQINYFNGNYNGRAATYGTPTQLAGDVNAQARAAKDLWGNGAGASNWPDAAVRAWRAAGAPKYPTQQQIQQYGGPASGSGTSAPAAATTGPGGSSASGVSGGALHDCNNGSKGISVGIGPLSANTGIGSACQLKALGAGLLIGLGAAVMVVGGVLIFFGPGRARGLVRSVAGGPAGVARRIVRARATSTPEEVVPDTAEREQALSDRGDIRAAREAGEQREQEAYDTGFMTGAASASPTPRNRRQANRQGEEAANRAGVARPGPGDRRTDRERRRAYEPF